jgi:pyrimidine deaminase RibD-like protein
MLMSIQKPERVLNILRSSILTSRVVGMGRMIRRAGAASVVVAGGVIVAADGSTLATGFSRERDPHDHAEEGALATLDPGDARLPGATLYSSLEPCRFRASRLRPCAELIIAAGVHRVVIAWLEPPVFAQGGGAELLRSSGVTVVEVPELADEARAVNVAVLGG